MIDKAERQRQSAAALAQQRANATEDANTRRDEQNQLDADIWKLEDMAGSEFEQRTASILRRLFERLT